MILNPTGMVKAHPEAKKVLAEYLSPMTNMNLTQKQAEELLDFLRAAGKEGKEKNIPEVPLFKSQRRYNNSKSGDFKNYTVNNQYKIVPI